jgi:hypothetical protein
MMGGIGEGGTQARCETCNYFYFPNSECRKNPPHQESKGFARWPVVFHDQWCGAWHKLKDMDNDRQTT